MKQPTNAFFSFVKANFRSATDALGGSRPKASVSALAATWRSLDADAKRPYQAMAAQSSADYKVAKARLAAGAPPPARGDAAPAPFGEIDANVLATYCATTPI